MTNKSDADKERYQRALLAFPEQAKQVLVTDSGYSNLTPDMQAFMSTMFILLQSNKENSAEMKAALDEAIRIANKDELTGEYNRRYFTAEVEKAVQPEQRANATPKTIVILDLDGFKGVNDRFGHPEGDVALIKTVKFIKDRLRAEDTLARIGGDEFGIIFNGTEKQAIDKMTAIRQELDQQPYVTSAAAGDKQGQKAMLSFCIGAHQIESGETKEEAIKKADDNTYLEKNGMFHAAGKKYLYVINKGEKNKENPLENEIRITPEAMVQVHKDRIKHRYTCVGTDAKGNSINVYFDSKPSPDSVAFKVERTAKFYAKNPELEPTDKDRELVGLDLAIEYEKGQLQRRGQTSPRLTAR